MKGQALAVLMVAMFLIITVECTSKNMKGTLQMCLIKYLP